MIKKVKKGFTLIELVVVIAVIAILSAVSVVAYVGITNNAKKSVAEQEAASLKTMLRAELTRESYEYKVGSDLKYTFSLDLENDRITYKAEDGVWDADEATKSILHAGMEELIVVAQGYDPATEATKSNYAFGSASEDKFGLSDAEAKFTNQLVLLHSNGQKAAVIGFAKI